MGYKVVVIFKVIPGNLEEELRRTHLALEILEQQPGLISYESVRTEKDEVVVTQGWQSKEQYQQAMAIARQQRATANKTPTVASREFHAGEVVFSR
jgi:heme-degrading monooxygenase HmoA